MVCFCSIAQPFRKAVKQSLHEAKRRGTRAFNAGRYGESTKWFSEALMLGQSAPSSDEASTKEQVCVYACVCLCVCLCVSVCLCVRVVHTHVPLSCCTWRTTHVCHPQVSLLLHRASAWAKLGNYAQAVEDSDMALSLQPFAPRALIKKGEALLQLKQYADASHAFMVALERNPHDEVRCMLVGKQRLCRQHRCGAPSFTMRSVTHPSCHATTQVMRRGFYDSLRGLRLGWHQYCPSFSHTASGPYSVPSVRATYSLLSHSQLSPPHHHFSHPLCPLLLLLLVDVCLAFPWFWFWCHTLMLLPWRAWLRSRRVALAQHDLPQCQGPRCSAQEK